MLKYINNISVLLNVCVLDTKSCAPTLTHVLSSKGDNVVGVTSMGNRLFVVRDNAQYKIEVYETATFLLQRNICVPGLTDSFALASCVVNNCLYASSYSDNNVHRVELSHSNKVTKWS